MKKLSLPFTVPNWVIWTFVGFALIVIGILAYSIFLYNGILSGKEEGYTEAEARAINETDMTTVNQVLRYHGDTFYYVVEGITSDDEQAIAFVPAQASDDSSAIRFFVVEDMVDEQAIKSNWQSSCQNCEFISINPAVEQSTLLWEIKYIDDNDRYVFAYYSFKDGSEYEQFKLRQSLY
ncbi:DUF5590 domain-containing protein [Aquibacillus salsiterrae]|uniref:DUF5590 domain-containing protein n=1 Tax=Aquibacillus salsiterrae TaxID=2950439 RepID=A0A9X3WAR8_9BACI|nr:DUF5590 domain-containing protein [Aquibacillus salsiterrae]MDC3415347.1 DUF5590 domain-containing protein [Aquibacillus salsiterrae]